MAGSACAFDGRLDNDVAWLIAAAARARCLRNPRRSRSRRTCRRFSLAIWDAANRSVVLACDFAGVRPLYYFATPSACSGRHLSPDLVRAAVPTNSTNGYVASFFRFPARGTHSLSGDSRRAAGMRRAGHGRGNATSSVSGICRSITKSGSPGEALRGAAAGTVSRGCSGAGRGHRQVLAELSGGLDSSSVACMAAN